MSSNLTCYSWVCSTIYIGFLYYLLNFLSKHHSYDLNTCIDRILDLPPGRNLLDRGCIINLKFSPLLSLF